jgi:N-acetylneuraminate lyase
MKLEGAIPALVTPYDSNGEVSGPVLRSLVDMQINAGVTGLYLCGGTGEGVLLRTSERKKVVDVVVGQCRGRVPVIVHVGSTSTNEAVELARHAHQAGADAISSVPPFFYPVSPDGIYLHYLRIAESSELPLIVYNIPALTGVSITPKIMQQISGIPTVIGIKFSSYNLFELGQMAALDKGRLTILSGNDEVFLGALVMGAHGSIGLTHNFMPKLYLDIFRMFKSGRCDDARELQRFAVAVIGALVKYPMISAAKEILKTFGYDCGQCRGPLESLSNTQSGELHQELTQLGFFEKPLGVRPMVA